MTTLSEADGEVSEPREGRPEQAPLRRHAYAVTGLCVVAVLIAAAVTWHASLTASEHLSDLRTDPSLSARQTTALTELTRTYETANQLLVATLASFAALMLASLALLTRNLGRPLESLVSALDVLARGKAGASEAGLKVSRDFAKLAGTLSRLRALVQEKAAILTELRLFGEFRHWLSMTRTEDELMKVTGEVAERLMPDMKGSLFVMSSGRNVLERARVWNGGAGPATVGMDECWSLRQGSTYTFGEGELDQCCTHAHDHAEAYCCVPLRAHGDLVGLLHVELKKQPGATKDHRDRTMAERRRVATACAEHLSLAISNLKLREHLRLETMSQDARDRAAMAILEAHADRDMMAECSRLNLAREYVDEEAERIICAVS